MKTVCFFIVILSDASNAFAAPKQQSFKPCDLIWIALQSAKKMVAMIPDLRRKRVSYVYRSAMPTVQRQQPPNRKIPIGRLLGTRKHREIQPAGNGLHCFSHWSGNSSKISAEKATLKSIPATLKVGNCAHNIAGWSGLWYIRSNPTFIGATETGLKDTKLNAGRSGRLPQAFIAHLPWNVCYWSWGRHWDSCLILKAEKYIYKLSEYIYIIYI